MQFDYPARKLQALKEEGYHSLIQSATIMTDPGMADVTYIGGSLAHAGKIIEKERPMPCCATMGGQTALNCALDLARHGVLENTMCK